MDTNIIVCLKTADGNPVSLSTGIRTLSADHYPLLFAFSASWGALRFPLAFAGCGPTCRQWVDARYYAHKRGDEMAAARLNPDANSISIGELSSPHMLWVESVDYTHVLMDAMTRRMVGVRPWMPDIGQELRNPWEDIVHGFDDHHTWSLQPGDPLPSSGGSLWQELTEADTRKVYACLHPAPVTAHGAAVWAFGGMPFVKINRPEVGVWEPTFLAKCVEIQLEDRTFV